MNQIYGFEYPRPNGEQAETNSMLREEPTLVIYHPIIGEALDPDSIQYRAMYQFLNNDINAPTSDLGHREHTNIQLVILKSYTPLMKGNEGPLRTISLKTYTRDNLGTHRRTQIIKGRVTHSMEDS